MTQHVFGGRLGAKTDVCLSSAIITGFHIVRGENHSLVTQCVKYTAPRGVWEHAPPGNLGPF